MHGAGEQQQQNAQQRYRFPGRNDETQQPTTSSQQSNRSMQQMQPMQVSLMCTPTTPTTSTAATSSGAVPANQRYQSAVKRLGEPIKFGDSILEPAGTLVFQQADNTVRGHGRRTTIHNNKNAVVANLFQIGSAPVLTMQPQIQGSNGNWYMNQQSSSSSHNVISLVQMTTNQSTTKSSATPDSGIQSVPTSPPSPRMELLNEQEIVDKSRDEDNDDDDDDDPADFTDMPRLKPVDEDDEYFEEPSTSSASFSTESNKSIRTINAVDSTTSTVLPSREEIPNGMSAEDILTFSLAANMDTNEIVRRLIGFDPEKANSIAVLIKKHNADKLKKKKDMEAEVSSTTPTTPRARVSRKRKKSATRSTNSPDVTTSNLPAETSTSLTEIIEESEEVERREVRKGRARRSKRKKTCLEEEPEELGTDDNDLKTDLQDQGSLAVEARCSKTEPTLLDPVLFRLKVHEMVERQLEQLTQKMSEDMAELRLSHSTTKPTSGKRKESFFRQLAEQSKKLKKLGTVVPPAGKRMRFFMTKPEYEVGMKPVESKKEIKEEEISLNIKSRISSRRSRTENSPDYALAPVEEKFNGEYTEIAKSVPYSDDIVTLWRAPSLSCGCTKGACTSDMECLNRALRVQCSNECTLPYCSNRRFWKEDCGHKLCVSNGPRTKRALKTKVARRAGDFLCEYAGEVITFERAYSKFTENQDAKIIAIGSQLFIDATNRGNIARFVKHSCNPNSRLEVWSVSGFYRAGVFALFDLSTNVEITVDKDGLLPFDTSCACGATNCRKIIRGVKSGVVANGDEKEVIETRRFLLRNRRRTIRKSRQSGLPYILLRPDNGSELLLKMRKTLAAFSFRVRRIDGSMARSMLPYYSSILTFLKVDARNPNLAEFVSLFRKWVAAIDDDDLERAFSAIESHYLSSSLLASTQKIKKSNENPTQARPVSSSGLSHVTSKRGDADLSYLESLYPIGSYDPDDAWETYRANASDNAVRCICGALDEDGGMVQCDKCHFWLHIDCCQYPVREEHGKFGKSKTKSDDKGSDNEENEYICDFCMGTQSGQRPCADVKLPDQPDVRFENCDYYRSLMNRRGIQVRLNETVYVNRKFPDDHKIMLRNLREEKKGLKHKEPNKYVFPEADNTPLLPRNVNRKDARIFRVERLFVCPGNNRFVFGSFYAWPHETISDTGRVFCKKEVFATPYYETLPLDEVIGRCLVVDVPTWTKGRPKVPKFKEEDVFLCEMQIGKNQRMFEKVPPKNRYPINTQPYVFLKFPQPKKIIKDFRPYDYSNPSPKPPRTVVTPNPITSCTDAQTSSGALPDVDKRKLSRKNIQKVLKHLVKLDSKTT